MLFSIDKYDNAIKLYNIDTGIVFIRKNIDNTLNILEEFNYLNSDYLNSIIEKLSEYQIYNFELLEGR